MRLRHVPLLVAVAGLGGWFLLLGPTSLGGPAGYVSVSGTSMEPTLKAGDLAVVRRADAYGRGDIVAFRVPRGEPAAGGLVIHRVVGGSALAGFVTQGDNKPRPDSWRPRQEDVVGALWVVIPGAGPILTRLRDPAVFAAIAAAITVFVLLIGGRGGHERRALPRPASVKSSAPLAAGIASASAPPPDPYAWTIARGRAICGGSVPRGGPLPIASQRRDPGAPPGTHVAAGTTANREDGLRFEAYRWTRTRGIAVCPAGRPWLRPLSLASSGRSPVDRAGRPARPGAALAVGRS